MQDGMDFSIIVFIILAAFVGWRLYNVLGTRPLTVKRRVR